MLFFSAVVVLHWNGSAAMMVGLIFENLDLLLCVSKYDQMPMPSNAGFQATYVQLHALFDPAILCMYILFGIWITLNYIGG